MRQGKDAGARPAGASRRLMMRGWMALIAVAAALLAPWGPAAARGPSPGNSVGQAEVAPAPEKAPMIAGIDIRLKNLSPDDDRQRLERMARAAIFLYSGDRFSADKLRQSIEALKLIKAFSDIHIGEASAAGGAIRLIFDLTRNRLVKDVHIEGAFPVLEREVVNVMTIYTGDVYSQSVVAEQEELIKALLRESGYFDPKVRIKPRKNPEDGNYDLHVHIDKGPYYELEDLRIRGNDAFAGFRIKLRMDVWHSSLLPGGSGRFIEKDLKEDIENLTDYYRSKGFPEVGITYDIARSREDREVVVTLNIHEGPFYDMAIKGNDEFWDYTLKKDVILFEKGYRQGRGISQSADNMRQRYREKGYPEASIDVDIRRADEGEREVVFRIEEGPRRIVEEVIIAGNQSFDDDRIMDQMLTRPPSLFYSGAFSKKELENDKNAILRFYYKNGFRNAEVTSDLDWNSDETKVTARVRIKEGIQTKVGKVSFSGAGQLLSHQQAADEISMARGEPFREYMVESDQNVLAALISEKGHPFVAVRGQPTFSQNGAVADIAYRMDPGPFVRMGEVFVTGNFKTRHRVVAREMEMEAGDPFSPKLLLESQKNIRNLDIFDSVRFKAVGLNERADRVDLFVEVEEKKPYVLSFGGGYDTERQLFAHVRAENRNLLGLDVSTWVSGEVSQIGYRAEYGLREPRLMGSRISAAMGIFAEEREELNQPFGTRSQGASVVFNRPFLENFDVSLGFRYEWREQFRNESAALAQSDILSEEELERRQFVVVSPGIAYDSRDSFIDPRWGIFADLSTDIYSGIGNNLDDFFKYDLEARFYLTPVRWVTFALRGIYGLIDPYGNNEKVPDDHLFFLGGTPDVRGFDENMLRRDDEDDPMGGREAILGSVEARVRLGASFQLAFFYDAGRISDAFKSDSSGEFRHTAGGGIRYVTPVGPIGFLYGFKLDKKENEPSGRLHFSIGYTF